MPRGLRLPLHHNFTLDQVTDISMKDSASVRGVRTGFLAMQVQRHNTKSL
jgi:hypothetical protein